VRLSKESAVACYIVTYDLNKEVVRPKIVELIKKLYPAWAKLSESSYAVSSPLTAQAIYNSLVSLLDGNDNLYVIPLSNPWFGRGPKAVNDWLDVNLK
jgi:predicted transcriptional regulator with HTH domain